MKSARKYLPWIIAAMLLGYLVTQALGSGDFKVFLEAAKMVAAGKNPYSQWLFISEGNYALYFYSPLWAVMLIPFSHLPNFIPNFLWLLANAWFLYRTWVLLVKYIDVQILPGKWFRWFVVLCILLNIRFVLYNFGMIQMTIFLLWGSLESLTLFRNNRFLTGGLLLALVINIKILPVVLIPYLIYRREIKGTLSTLAFSILFLLLPALALGWHTNLFLHSEWWTVVNPNNAEHLLESGLGVHSLTALIPVLLTKTEGALPYSRNIFSLNIEITVWIVNSIRAGLILLTVYFLRWPPFRGPKSGLHELRELGYLFLLIPLIFPHQQKYAFYLALPALFYITYWIIVNIRSRSPGTREIQIRAVWFLFLLSFVLMTLTTDLVIGRNFNQVTQHFKTITYGTLVLIILLACCAPGKITNRQTTK